MRHILKVILVSGFLVSLSCSSTKKFWQQSEPKKNKTFEELVKVESVKPDELTSDLSKKNEPEKTVKTKKTSKTKKKPRKKMTPVKKKISNRKLKKAPPVKKEKAVQKAKQTQKKAEGKKELSMKELIEKTPFRKGQKTTIEVSYLNMTAGYLTMETKDIVKVNGQPSFHFSGKVWSRKLFSFVYSVQNNADTYVDINDLKPYSLVFSAKETKKVKDSKTFFDWKNKKATYWSYKVKKGRKPSEKNLTWDLVKGSQNFVSALFYIRTFDFKNLKKFSFPLADEGKNIVLKAKVLGLETLDTEIGEIKAWAIKPSFEIKGSLAPTGKVKIWVRDHPAREIVRIEAKLKFGSIVGEVIPN